MSALAPMAPMAPGIPPTSDRRPQDLRQAAEAFEALFLNMLLKSMRQTIPEGGLFDSQQMQGYQEMQDRELANDLARRGSVGIAELMVRQLGGGSFAKPESKVPAADAAFGYQTLPVAPGRRAAGAVAPSVGTKADVKSGFIRKLLPIAAKYAAQLSLPAPVLIAQAALETGWGEHMPRVEPGGSSHNLFGLKAGSDWQGLRSRALTQEYRGSTPRTEKAEFRGYQSIEESFADYAALIRGSSRYADARDAADPAAYLRSLQTAGYATDPQYADKVLAIVNDADFQRRLGQVANAPEPQTNEPSLVSAGSRAR